MADDEPLATELKKVFGSDTTLGSAELQTLLLLVMRNASADSPWPISNNPYAKYNDPVLPDSNLKFRLWQLVRASTAAPTYFPPEVIVLPGKKGEDTQFVFVEGPVMIGVQPRKQFGHGFLHFAEVERSVGIEVERLDRIGRGDSQDGR